MSSQSQDQPPPLEQNDSERTLPPQPPPEPLEEYPRQDEEAIGRRPTLFRKTTLRRRATLNRPERAVDLPPMLKSPSLNRKKNNLLDRPSDSTIPSWWVLLSWAFTCCFPAPVLKACGIANPSMQQAWREKVALCWIVFILSTLVVFFLVFFNYLLCPPALTDNRVNVNAFGGVVVFGTMYDSFNVLPPYNTLFELTNSAFGGIDVSAAFRQPAVPACQVPSVQKFSISRVVSLCEPDSCLDMNTLRNVANFRPYNTILSSSGRNISIDPVPAYEWSEVRRRRFLVVQQRVLNLAPYFNQFPDPLPNDPIDGVLRAAQQIYDGTHLFWQDPNFTPEVMNCLMDKYNAGTLSQLPPSCILSRIVTIVVSIAVMGIIMTRFFMALLFDWFLASRVSRTPSKNNQSQLSEYVAHQKRQGANRYRLSLIDSDFRKANESQSSHIPSMLSNVTSGSQANPGLAVLRRKFGATAPLPNEYDMYTVCLVTCYSEGEKSMRTTLDALAATDYDDAKKLLFVIADGLVRGSGNDRTTPDIVLNMMDHDHYFGPKPEAYSYVAVATGSKQHNMARVYSGSYPYMGRAVPMIVVVKCGTSDEQSAAKPGNRGKRDSQLILMNFFSRVVLNDRMTPLDYDIFRKIRHITGVTPDTFDLVLMVDADTCVQKDCMRMMINTMQNDPMVMGLCGETRIANPSQNWVTRIQVFEYFISHHLGKAFESVFGGVTCLPGCFCMYRIKTLKDGSVLPIIANPDIIEQYSTNEVYTLHQKNLLLLGEDRFLTTLMLRTFPRRKMVYVPSAYCQTVVPDDFKTLVSQRRRWINSTIHNLMELVLVSNLCGTFCFSMQFVVFMDLIGTAVLPASLLSLYYLIVSSIFRVQYTDVTSILNLVTVIVVLILPAFLVVMTGKGISHLYWMSIYLLALPVWQFILPLYAFWHFDDFSWGETRKVTGEESSKAGHGDDEFGLFDGTKIPFKRWDEYEREWRRAKYIEERKVAEEELERRNSQRQQLHSQQMQHQQAMMRASGATSGFQARPIMAPVRSMSGHSSDHTSMQLQSGPPPGMMVMSPHHLAGRPSMPVMTGPRPPPGMVLVRPANSMPQMQIRPGPNGPLDGRPPMTSRPSMVFVSSGARPPNPHGSMYLPPGMVLRPGPPPQGGPDQQHLPPRRQPSH